MKIILGYKKFINYFLAIGETADFVASTWFLAELVAGKGQYAQTLRK